MKVARSRLWEQKIKQLVKLISGRLETVSEFVMNPKSCHDTEAETEPTRRCVPWKLVVGSKQLLYGAGLKPDLGRIHQERAGFKPAPTAASCYDFGRCDNSETRSL